MVWKTDMIWISGTGLHVDPDVTDAWNGIVAGTKWWAYLPKDFYEAEDEWTCDPECSPVEENDLHNAALWIYNMLPQLRFEKFQVFQIGFILK